MSEKLTKLLTPIVALFFATALGVTAATTIGTDITTDGDLTVTGSTTLSDTLDVTGATTLGALSVSGDTEFADGGVDAVGFTVNLTGESGANISIGTTYGTADITTVEEDLTLMSTYGGVHLDANDVIASTTSFIVLNSAGGGNEVLVQEDITTFDGDVIFTATGTEVLCDGTKTGAVRYATGDNQLCFCNGSNWFQVASTTQSCTFNAN